MELKYYQQQVLDDLSLYLDQVQEYKDVKTAFSLFWHNHPRTPLFPTEGEIIEPYKNNVQGVPHICIKVPTAGGKTFIASNALKHIFKAFNQSKSKSVVWLVPSVTILEQTIKNLADPFHPYRQKINMHFANRVEVYDKDSLLAGSNFNATTVKENLSIFVLSFDSLRARKKEDKKAYKENGNLQSFEHGLPENKEITLMSVIQSLNPIVVVDESHNAETDLSVEMLTNLNPSFILDLTATPRKNSNIISFVDAFELKKENMVKLPVIVYNQNDKTEVIASAIKMQRKLEDEAMAEEKISGKYIRPIVLLQAQPKNKDDSTTFEKIKSILIKSGIPENQIRIKTANLNEIRGIDLMSRNCEVRYIITVNALKEGWDCPFAYVLATLADKSSAVDVEQILGRILRQPYVSKHISSLLNMSYVLTASSKFNQTLENIVKGLNKAGFSSKDYKIAEPIEKPHEINVQGSEQLYTTDLFSMNLAKEISEFEDININKISQIIQTAESQKVTEQPDIELITNIARSQARDMEKMVEISRKNNSFNIPTDLNKLVRTITVKKTFLEEVRKIKLPQFVFGKTNEIFGENDIVLDKDLLIEDFALDKADININFTTVTSEMYKIDLDDSKQDSTPTYLKIDGKDRKQLIEYISAPTTTNNAKLNTLIANVKDNMGSMYPIPDQRLNSYLSRIFENFDNDEYFSFIDNIYTYSLKIKKKIHEEANKFARKRFKELLDMDKIEMKSLYSFSETISPLQTIDFLPKSLYEKEAKINNFESQVINEVANMENILFWTRNLEFKGFRINGFINHYPDFIIFTKKGNIIVLEIKGDHLEAEAKIELGNIWASKAGQGYKYFLVYDERDVKGAYRKNHFLELIKEL